MHNWFFFEACLFESPILRNIFAYKGPFKGVLVCVFAMSCQLLEHSFGKIMSPCINLHERQAPREARSR